MKKCLRIFISLFFVVFVSLLVRAENIHFNDEIYLTLLDEMNISRVEYYFAEMLSILELPNKIILHISEPDILQISFLVIFVYSNILSSR